MIDFNVEFAIAWDALKPVVWSVNQDDLNDADFATIAGWRIDLVGIQNLTGIVNTVGGTQVRWIVNETIATDLTLLHEDALSAPANRFNLPESDPYVIRGGMGAFAVYDTVRSRWVLMSSGRL